MAKRMKRDDDETLLEVIPDDLLATEILPRLADSRTAIRSSAVSKHWHSLLSAAEFIPNFIRHHRSSYSMLVDFRFHSRATTQVQRCPKHLMVEGESKVTAGVSPDYNFPGRKLIFDSACDEFLLFSSRVTQKSPARHLYIRNSVTGRWLELPELPVKEQHGFCALVSHPDSTLSRYSYRVVYITRMSKDGGPLQHWCTIFSSETGQWSDLRSSPEIRRMPLVVAINGLLFLLFKMYGFRLVLLDAFTVGWRFISLPSDLLLSGEFYGGFPVEFGPAEEVEQLGSCKDQPMIGAVRGRLRLAQLFKSSGLFVMKIWELCGENNETWLSVSTGVKLRAPPRGTEWVYLFGFHPDDGDVVFLCCDSDVYRYRVSTGEYENVFRLSCRKGNEQQSLGDSLPRFARVFTVALPPWPTTIPALPRSIF